MRKRSRTSPTIILLLVSSVFIFLPVAFGNSIKRWFVEVLLPAQTSCATLVRGVKDLKTNLEIYFKETRDYQRLLERVQGLENQISELREVEQENRRLIDLIEFKKTLATPSVVARVIGWDTSAWASSLIIDKGEKQGIGVNMTVVYENGLVGRVIETAKHVSRVLLVTDPKNKVGARLQRTREIGIVQGASVHVCRMTYISKFADVVKDDVVVTSGLSAFYPKGVPLGKITEVYADDQSLYKSAFLKPMVVFSQLEEVVVLKWKSE